MRSLTLAEKFRSEMLSTDGKNIADKTLIEWFAKNVGDTGLRDKNGVPISEGDRVRFYHKGEYVECTVIYDIRNAAYLLQWNDGYVNQYFMNGSNYEVVGSAE